MTFEATQYSLRPASRLNRVACIHDFTTVINGLGMPGMLASVFLPGLDDTRLQTIEKVFVLENTNKESLFVVLPYETLECPQSGKHKHARREIWLGRYDVTLRCFSKRCLNQTPVGTARRGTLHTLRWAKLAALLGDDNMTDPDDLLVCTVYMLQGLLATWFKIYTTE